MTNIDDKVLNTPQYNLLLESMQQPCKESSNPDSLYYYLSQNTTDSLVHLVTLCIFLDFTSNQDTWHFGGLTFTILPHQLPWSTSMAPLQTYRVIVNVLMGAKLRNAPPVEFLMRAYVEAQPKFVYSLRKTRRPNSLIRSSLDIRSVS